ncbi:hypothetical protein N7530_011046 [Penicillium desertorum]|uniref:Uncharacterized protein n=1 Tax=Penicillium desertorum TaxID=1303715 RepID=A0A9W9WGG9_9EURO|nr:hypothetical protein N7530_011046 [Penicillium desertorum]
MTQEEQVDVSVYVSISESSEDSSSDDEEEDSPLVISIGSSGLSSRLLGALLLLPAVSLAPLVRPLTLLPTVHPPRVHLLMTNRMTRHLTAKWVPLN